MNELSIFIDESGYFGETDSKLDYYLVTFVFHDQSKDISNEIKILDDNLKRIDKRIEYIHTGPIIRKEAIFEKYSLDERRQMIYKMLNFVIKCPVQYHTIVINRKEASDKVQLSGKLGKSISKMLDEYSEYINAFDKVIVYYDNGQRELGSILNAILSVKLSNVEFRKADPREYRLLQVADFFCSIDLIKIKRDEGRLSKSEENFFYKPNELKKTFINGIKKKQKKEQK